MFLNALNILLSAILLLSTFAGPADASTIERTEPLKVAVSVPDLVPVVESTGGALVDVRCVLPPGEHPIDYKLTDEETGQFSDIELFIFTKSDFYDFERALVAAYPNVNRLDFPSYERRGAVIADFERFPANVHGYWMDYSNMEAIAQAVAETLLTSGIPPQMISTNLLGIRREIGAQKQSSLKLLQDLNRERSVWVAATPETAYILKNLGLLTGAILEDVDGNMITEAERIDIDLKLRDGELAGIVCPEISGNRPAGQMAERMSGDTGMPLAWVRFADCSDGESFLSLSTYNTARISSAAAAGEMYRKNLDKVNEGFSFTNIIWGIVVAGLFMWIILLNKRLHYGVYTRAPAGKDSKGKMKK